MAVFPDGSVEVMPTPAAVRKAQDMGLDLILVSPTAEPPVAKAMDYMLTRWSGFAAFLDDGRICLTNNAAERALRGLALGRKAWLFAGSERGADRAAMMYTLIVTARVTGVTSSRPAIVALRRCAGRW